MKRFVVAVLLGVALAAAGVRGAARSYAVTWNTATSQWALDGVAAPVLTLVPALTYEFAVAGETAGATFWLSFSDNVNDTASALKPEDGVTNNLCTPPCTITYVPPMDDLNQIFYYLSSVVDNAGNEVHIKACTDLADQAACGKAAGCGWTTTCISCSSLTTSATCQGASACSWCVDPEACVAETDTTCASFIASSEEGAQMLYLLFLLLIPVAGAAIFAVVMVVKKSTYKKRNEAMFRIEDEMSVLGGRPAADDNTL